MAISLPTASRNASTNAVVDLIDAGAGAGVVDIRTTPRPNAADAATGTLLATVTLADPAFGNSATGTATLTDPATVTGIAAGIAAWFRVQDSTGASVYDGSVGATGSGADMELNTTTISVGLDFNITGGSYTTPIGG